MDSSATATPDTSDGASTLSRVTTGSTSGSCLSPNATDESAATSSNGLDDETTYDAGPTLQKQGGPRAPCRGSAGELRRRKYFATTSEAPGWWSRAQTPGELATAELDNKEVLVQGPLQEHKLLFYWQWRWCVLDWKELRIYASEDAFAKSPERPLRRFDVHRLHMALDLDSPSVLVCMSADSGALSMLLRSGPGQLWEEVAAAKLWLRMFASAGRYDCPDRWRR